VSEQPELALQIAAEAATGRELSSIPLDEDLWTLPGRRRNVMRQVKYWRRPRRGNRDDGWICVGPTRNNPYEWQAMIASGFEELPDEYGVEYLNTGDISDVGNQHRTFVPLIKNGGLKEMPPEQIVSLGWHKVEAIRRVLTSAQRAAVDRIVANAVRCEYGCVDNRGEPLEFYWAEDLARHNKVEHGTAEATTGAVRAMERSLEATLQKITGVDEQRMQAMLTAIMRSLLEMAQRGATVSEVEEAKEQLVKEAEDAVAKRRTNQ